MAPRPRERRSLRGGVLGSVGLYGTGDTEVMEGCLDPGLGGGETTETGPGRGRRSTGRIRMEAQAPGRRVRGGI